MTFKEAFEHYRQGKASAEELMLVEEELEKNRLIAEYLDEELTGSEDIPAAAYDIPTDPDDDIIKIRRGIRRRGVWIILISLILAAALAAGVWMLGIPALESLYWDPRESSYGINYQTDIENMLSAYMELFCPRMIIAGANAEKTGFASYDVAVQIWDPVSMGRADTDFITVKKGELKIPSAFFSYCSMNIFDKATYPYYSFEESVTENTRKSLEELPDYISVVAAVSFKEDKTMDELVELQESLKEGHISWAGIRGSAEDEQLVPLCGMQLFSSGVVREFVNNDYPFFEIKGQERTGEILEQHFISLLKYSADRAEEGRGFDIESRTGESYYRYVLDHVLENGIMSYGCFVIAPPSVILELMDREEVSQVYVEDIYLGM